MGGCTLCVSLFLCSPLFASLLLPRPVQLARLRRSLRLRLRPQSPAPSTSSGNRRYFIRSWPATARPRVSGSAASSSATLIASNVIVLSADPFGSQSPPLGNLGRVLFWHLRPQVGLACRFDPRPLPGSSLCRGRRSAATGVIGDNCFAADLMERPVSCCAGRCADAQWPPMVGAGPDVAGPSYFPTIVETLRAKKALRLATSNALGRIFKLAHRRRVLLGMCVDLLIALT
jgi:hypothetical protein